MLEIRLTRFNDLEAEEEQAREGSRNLAPPAADMNVTPLIDVLLVLLVIFMAALPLTQKGLDINLPQEVTKATTPPQQATQVVVELTDQGKLLVNKKEIAPAELEMRLRDTYEARTDKVVFIIGPGTARYGTVMSIIDVAYGVGLKVVLVTSGMRTEAGGK